MNNTILPDNVDEAIAMMLLGEAWLRRFAPEKLKEIYQETFNNSQMLAMLDEMLHKDLWDTAPEDAQYRANKAWWKKGDKGWLVYVNNIWVRAEYTSTFMNTPFVYADVKSKADI